MCTTSHGLLRLVFLTTLVLNIEQACSQQQQQPQSGPWRTGRATFFGSDAWKVNAGSCNYGNIYQDEPLGWSVAALPDVDPAYPDACGRCLEVACVPMQVTDGNSVTVDRTSACYSNSTSVVVRVTDTCPCYFTQNYQSNKRWCCGDANHVDVSVWAWERLADKKWGVIGVRFRPVPCDYQPLQLAPTTDHPTPMYGAQSLGKRTPRGWPEYFPNSVNPQVIYQGGTWPSWSLSQTGTTPTSNTALLPLSQAVTPINPLNTAGASSQSNTTPLPLMGKGSPICTMLQPGGSVNLTASAPGLFTNRVSLVLWAYMGDVTNDGASVQSRRAFNVAIGGAQGMCRTVNLLEVKTSAYVPACLLCNKYWWRFEIFLNTFTAPGPVPVLNVAQMFKGCGNQDVSALTLIRFGNPSSSQPQALCIDHIQLN